MEKTSRFEHFTEEGLKRIFTDKEIEYAKSFEYASEHFCGFFCVKEAFVKALDDTSLNYKEIEILHTETGRPFINRSEYIESLLKEKHANILECSISHMKDYASAVVLVQ